MLASAHLLKGDPGEAEKALRQGVGSNPKSVALLFALADLYLKSKRPGDAIVVLQEVLKIEPGQCVRQPNPRGDCTGTRERRRMPPTP